ncbi:MAG: MATE family efflux transporter [Candidatus Delongbacteria bacterium]|nr:MATE family efflux transporter [Candidatus Delongbacteria bacterium]MBN2836007.1 MATE family efflux transporter [Candidatus Delongbacteria bacterium]
MKNRSLDLTTGDIFSKLIKLSLPIMISNFMQTVYNLTDTYWLGKMDVGAKEGVAIAGLAFPLIFFLSSFGFGFVVAGTSLVSQFKGAGKFDQIQKVLGQYVFISIIFAALFLIGGYTFLEDVLKLLNTPEEIMKDSIIYIGVILPGIAFMFIFMVFQAISHGLGDTISPMKAQMWSIGLNLFVDPILIYGMFSIPEMGVLGAAIATLAARFLALVLMLRSSKKIMKDFIPTLADIKPDKDMLRKILSIGIPSSLSQSMTSFGFLLLQGFVNYYGTAVISVYSIGNRMTGFYMMPAMGISNALSSMIGQNLGAGKMKRVEESVGKAFLLVTIIMFIGGTFKFVFAAEITKFFINDAEIITMGIRMFRITAVASFIFGFMFVFTGVFNGAGYTRQSMYFNVARLWLFRIPLVLLFSGYLLNFDLKFPQILDGLLKYLSSPLKEIPYDALWWSMIVSNFIATIWAYLLYVKGDWKKGAIRSVK